MGRYIVKRILYSIWILLGIMVVTFVLFRVSAGDPTAVLLGKNPTAADVEAMRDSMGCDKPLFFGLWRITELYPSADFTGGRTEIPGIELNGIQPEAAGQDGLRLGLGSIAFKRQFTNKEAKNRIVLSGSGRFRAAGQDIEISSGGTAVELKDAPDELTVAGLDENCVLVRAGFERPNRAWYDSQALDSIKELVTFSAHFPYVSFFNFGNTLLTHESIRGKLWRGMGPSLMIMLPIFFGELLLGIVLAMISCAFQDRILDRAIVVLSVAGMSISYLVLIILGQWFLAYYLNLFPVWGWDSPTRHHRHRVRHGQRRTVLPDRLPRRNPARVHQDRRGEGRAPDARVWHPSPAKRPGADHHACLDRTAVPVHRQSAAGKLLRDSRTGL